MYITTSRFYFDKMESLKRSGVQKQIFLSTQLGKKKTERGRLFPEIKTVKFKPSRVTCSSLHIPGNPLSPGIPDRPGSPGWPLSPCIPGNPTSPGSPFSPGSPN